MKKYAVRLITILALTALLMTSVFAAYQPSKAQQEVKVSDAAVTDNDGNETKVEILDEAPAAADGSAQNVVQVERSIVVITPVSKTIEANKNYEEKAENQNKTFAQLADALTGDGLTYATNALTNQVYAAATKAQSVTQFLESVNKSLTEDVKAAIQAKADEEQANDPEYVNPDNFAPVSLFDVTASTAVQEILKSGGAVTVELEVDGVNKDSDLLALHFFGDVADAEAELDYEILDVTVTDEGKVSFQMTHFSPVMLLTRVDAPEAPAEEPTAEATEAPEDETPATEAPAAEAPAAQQPAQGGSSWIIWVAVAAVAAIVVIAVAVSRKNKKKTGEKV